MTPSRRLPLIVTALAFAALVVAPGAWQAALPAPSYSTATAALLMVALTVVAALTVVLPTRRLRWRPAVAVALLLGLKLGIGALDVPTGWRGEYTMLAPEPPLAGQFVWRLGVHPFRVDRDIVFEATGFDLPFLNNYLRYNGRPADAPPRATSKPLRIAWTGWFDTPADSALVLYAQAHGSLDVRVDGHAWTTTGADTAPVRRTVAAGRHRVDVVYHKPAGTAPAVFARFLLDGRPLCTSPWPVSAVASSWPPLAPLTDGLVLCGLIVLLWQTATAWRGALMRRHASRAGAAAALLATIGLAGWAVVSADTFVGRTVELRPGDDHLAYEGLARNVLEEGLLMPEGRRPGEGRSFFFYPLYSYALAATHLLLGDGYGSVVLMNAGATAMLPLLMWLLGWSARPWFAQLAGQALLVAFVLRHNARYIESPLTDNLFIPCVLATLVLAVRAVRTARPLDAFLTGCAVAACATTRPSAFLLIPLLAGLFAWTSAGPGLWRRAAPVAAVAAGYAVALAPVVLRNWIMARQAVAMVTLSHAIPVSLIPPEAQTPEFMKRAALWSWSASLQLAGSLIAADPWGIVWLELRKILFTLGITSLGPSGTAMIWELPLIALAGIAAFALRRVPFATTAVLLTFLVSHFAAIVIAYPWTYGYKTILPVHLVFLFAAVHLIGRPPAEPAGG